MSNLNGDDLVRTARDLARLRHRGEDKAKRPYILHPARVAARVEQDYGPEFVAVAWMHDLIEDEGVKVEELRGAGFPESVIAGVVAMTKLPDDEPDDAIQRACADRIALVVKAADVADNTDPNRLALLDDHAKRDKLVAKYQRYRQILDEHGAPTFMQTVPTPTF